MSKWAWLLNLLLLLLLEFTTFWAKINKSKGPILYFLCSFPWDLPSRPGSGAYYKREASQQCKSHPERGCREASTAQQRRSEEVSTQGHGEESQQREGPGHLLQQEQPERLLPEEPVCSVHCCCRRFRWVWQEVWWFSLVSLLWFLCVCLRLQVRSLVFLFVLTIFPWRRSNTLLFLESSWWECCRCSSSLSSSQVWLQVCSSPAWIEKCDQTNNRLDANTKTWLSGSGISSLDSKASGKMGARAVAYYMVTTLVAVFIGIVIVVIIRPGKGSRDSPVTKSGHIEPVQAADAFLDLIR